MGKEEIGLTGTPLYCCKITVNVAGLDGYPETLTSGGDDSTVIHGKVIFSSKCTPYKVSSNLAASSGSFFNTDANESISTFLSDVDLKTYNGTSQAIGICDGALCKIDRERGELGAIQNRFESTISNLQNISENLAAARSRIMDADIAAETSSMTKQNILQQAGVSILSQANQQPQLALSLLGDL